MTTSQLPTLSADLVKVAKTSRGPLNGYGTTTLVAIERQYRMFLMLIKKHRDTVIAPTELIDEMWHLHMLHPVAYAADCKRILGFVLDHNPGFGSEHGELPELLTAFSSTETMWEKEFGEQYVVSFIEKVTLLPTGVVMCETKPEAPAEEETEDEGEATELPAPAEETKTGNYKFNLPMAVVMCGTKIEEGTQEGESGEVETTEVPAPAEETKDIGYRFNLPRAVVMCGTKTEEGTEEGGTGEDETTGEPAEEGRSGYVKHAELEYA